MKVKIGDTIYDGNDIPIMLILSDLDKKLICSMEDEATKYCMFPESMSEEDVRTWMRDI